MVRPGGAPSMFRARMVTYRFRSRDSFLTPDYRGFTLRDFVRAKRLSRSGARRDRVQRGLLDPLAARLGRHCGRRLSGLRRISEDEILELGPRAALLDHPAPPFR